MVLDLCSKEGEVKRIVVLCFLFLFIGCETEPIQFENQHKFKDAVQYFMDKKGNCFAIIGIRRTGSAAMSGMGLTLVPHGNCARVRP